MASRKNVQDAHMSANVRALHDALISVIGVMNRPDVDKRMVREAGIALDGALFPLLVTIERLGPIGIVGRRTTVTVRHDGRKVAGGSAPWEEAVERLDLLTDLGAADHVATGSITELLDCLPGRWEFDFGTLGHLAVTVV